MSVSFQALIAILCTIYFHSIPNKIKPILVLPYATGVVAPAFALKVAVTSSIGPLHLNLLGDSLGAASMIALIDTWQWVGILLLACLQKCEQIPYANFEQAAIEGISKYRRWWLVTRPEIQNIILFYCVIRFIDWIRKVDVIKALFGQGGPGYSVETIGMYIIRIYYNAGETGYASFLSLLQILVLGVFVIIVMRPSIIKKVIHSW